MRMPSDVQHAISLFRQRLDRKWIHRSDVKVKYHPDTGFVDVFYLDRFNCQTHEYSIPWQELDIHGCLNTKGAFIP